MQERTPRELLSELLESFRKITEEELEKYPTLHFCQEWDGLPIDEFCPEFDACSCFSLSDLLRDHRKLNKLREEYRKFKEEKLTKLGKSDDLASRYDPGWK